MNLSRSERKNFDWPPVCWTKFVQIDPNIFRWHFGTVDPHVWYELASTLKINYLINAKTYAHERVINDPWRAIGTSSCCVHHSITNWANSSIVFLPRTYKHELTKTNIRIFRFINNFIIMDNCSEITAQECIWGIIYLFVSFLKNESQ